MIIRRRDNNERPSPVRQVFIVGLAGLLIAGLLNAGAILERAKQKPFGFERDVWVAIWTPVEWTSSLLQLDHPHAWIENAIGRGEPPPASEPGEPGTTPTPTPERPPLPVRDPTADNPLRLWIGGDSQAQVFGESLVTFASDTGVIAPALDYRISSGLTRPDYFDWPAHLAAVAADTSPDVMVIVFGANDAQGIETATGDIFQPLEDGWRNEYRSRVASTMDLLRADGRMQVWVGQPIAAAEGYSRRMADINAIIESEASARPWVRYFDSWSLFTDANGKYTSFLPDGSGGVEDVRQDDGVHLTRAGGDRLARAILDVIGVEVDLTPAAGP